MRLFLPLLVIAVAGCNSHRVPPHTLLKAANGRQFNIWSYEPVAGEGHVTRTMRAGDRAVLDGGTVVTFDGERVSVNGKQVTSLNAVVDRDGDVHEGAFIRTFD